jgi:4'-phosphopantetheinyl transferase
MRQIHSGHVHLWLAFLDEIVDPHLLAQYRLLLSEEELLQQARFHFERDRHRYLVTRALVRTVLSEYAPVAPRDWRFAVNAYGRPSIATEFAAARRVEFNVSHTNGLVVLGLTCERAIGVDVENVGAREASIEIANRYFAHEEVNALRSLPREQQQQRFFEYWTLKESYVKARGMGLSIPLDQFSFDLAEPGHVSIAIDNRLHDHSTRWHFWQTWLAAKYLAAVCVRRADERPEMLTWRVVPLLDERACPSDQPPHRALNVRLLREA